MGNYNIKILQMLEFFITKHNYVIVNFDDDASKIKNEVWIFKAGSKDYQLIRITIASVQQVLFEKNRIEQIKTAITSKIATKVNFLDIHINNDKIGDEELYPSVAINTNYYDGIDLSEIFPGIKNVIHEIDNNVEDKKILSHINNHFRKQVDKYLASKKPKKATPIATYVIMAICVIITVLINVLGNSDLGYIPTAIFFGAYYKAFILALHEYWRFLTVGFVHIGFFHLIMNMYALYFLGTFYERVYGTKKFLITLFASVIGGSVFIYITQTNGVTVGLSGGLFGLIAGYFLYMFDTGIIANPRVRNNLLLNLFLIIIISFAPNVSYMAHIGGFVTGLLISMLYMKNKKFEMLVKNAKIALVILIIMGGYLVSIENDLDASYYGTDLSVAEIANQLNLKSYANTIEVKMLEYYNTNEGVN